jgi:anti-sigma28 factor (negative regulator of flagellin synthesis)
LRTEMQTSSVAISNVIPFRRRTEPIKKNVVHGTEQSGKAGELDLALMESTVGALVEQVESHSVVKQDKVERMRQRLLTGLYSVDAEQIAGNMLRKQLLAQLLESRKTPSSDGLGISVTWSRNEVTDEAS